MEICLAYYGSWVGGAKIVALFLQREGDAS